MGREDVSSKAWTWLRDLDGADVAFCLPAYYLADMTTWPITYSIMHRQLSSRRQLPVVDLIRPRRLVEKMTTSKLPAELVKRPRFYAALITVTSPLNRFAFWPVHFVLFIPFYHLLKSFR